MAVIAPQTNIKLLKVPISLDEKNQLTFSSATAQYNYFNSLPKLEYDSCTYQRKDGYMAIYEDADTLQQYNYCMYQNTQYGNKWFYAFITNITYEGNEVSYVYIKTDVYQTWLMEATFKRSFVEREHTNDDTVGANTIPENLEIGEFKINDVSTYNMNGSYSEPLVILATTIEPLLNANDELIGTNNGGGVYGGIKTGYKCYSYTRGGAMLPKVLKAFEEAGKSDSIVAMFMLPATLVTSDPNLPVDGYAIPDDNIGRQYTWNITGLTTLDSYSPTNNKLYTFPYRYLYVTNLNGGNAIYHYEKFSNVLSMDFRITGVITPTGSVNLVPDNYNGASQNLCEMLSGAKYPICGYQNDVYKNWLTQNGLNISSKLAGGVVAMVGGVAAAATGLGLVAGAATAFGGVAAVYSVLQDINQKKNFTPPQAEGNVNTGDVNFARGWTNFRCYQMSIKSEVAKVVDNYFSMFGYKTNRVKMPNLSGRTNWNYVKTIDANIIGDIPQNDLNEIKELFNKGITLWHNPSTFLDYSQPNNIV